jgi:hypothetical protein
MAASISHRLQNIRSRISASGPDEDIISISGIEIEMPTLPPTDYGTQAYLVLAGCTLIQAPVWGKYRFRQCLHTT